MQTFDQGTVQLASVLPVSHENATEILHLMLRKLRCFVKCLEQLSVEKKDGNFYILVIKSTVE